MIQQQPVEQPKSFSAPVTVFVFNRPATTQLLVERLAQLKPPKLYVVCDGPRSSKITDVSLISETLSLFDNLPWDCAVEFNNSEINLGCRDRITSGISWVLSKESYSIFLEDDCLPSRDFFHFCQTMLEKFASDESVGMISGVRQNFYPKLKSSRVSFTRVPRIWGWATWASRWDLFDGEMANETTASLEAAAKWGNNGYFARKHWLHRFDESRRDKSIWDAQWVYALWKNQLFCVQPPVNLVSNIGFGDDATHTNESASLFNNWPSYDLTWPLYVPSSKRLKLNLIENLALRIENYILWLRSYPQFAHLATNLFRIFRSKR